MGFSKVTVLVMKIIKQPKRTKASRCKEIGISITTLMKLEKAGVAIFDDAQIRKAISGMRNLPPYLKPEWMPRIPSPKQEIKPLLRFTACLDELVDIAMDESIDKHERLAVVVYRIKQMAEYIEVKRL
jgi:hypothetical protein